MTASKQVDYSFGTVVSDTWLDRIQEINAPLAWNAGLRISGTSVVMTASSDSGAAALVIEGKMRYVEASLSIPFTGKPAGDYGIWATTSNNDNSSSFGLEAVIVPSTPSAERNRKVGQVTWNGTTLTNLLQFAGYSTHAHMHRAGQDPLPDGSITSNMIADNQSFKAASGSISAPSYSFTGESTTGIYKDAVSSIAFTTSVGGIGLRVTNGVARSNQFESDSFTNEASDQGLTCQPAYTGVFFNGVSSLRVKETTVEGYGQGGFSTVVPSSVPLMSGYFLTGKREAESVHRFLIRDDGFVLWSSGSGVADAWIYRSSAGRLTIQNNLTVNGTVTELSDATLKSDIKPLSSNEALNSLRSLPINSWSWQDKTADPDSHVGPTAQDYHRIFSPHVLESAEPGSLGYSSRDLLGYTVAAVQALANKIEELETRLVHQY